MEQNVSQINGGIKISVDVSECKNNHVCETYYVWNHATCNCNNGKNLEKKYYG